MLGATATVDFSVDLSVGGEAVRFWGESPPLDVRLYVEVAEQEEHDDHVADEEVLTPAREVTADADWVCRVSERDDKLDLWTHRNVSTNQI